jgi:hypothetical protein
MSNEMTITLLIAFMMNFTMVFILFHYESKRHRSELNEVLKLVRSQEYQSRIDNFKIILECLNKLQYRSDIILAAYQPSPDVPAKPIDEKEYRHHIQNQNEAIKGLIRVISSWEEFYKSVNEYSYAKATTS